MEIMEIDFAKLDHDRLIEYLKMCGGRCLVKDIIKDSVVEKLRVYSLLAKMSIDREIRVLNESNWGAPIEIALYD